MKNKLKYYLISGILYFGTLFLLWNCEKGNIEPIEEQQPMIETVAVNEAIDFFTVKAASQSAKSIGKAYVTPHLEHIAQEAIINSDALLTVIPATTIYEEHYSRILLLKIDNEIQSLVFSMHVSDVNTQYFTGEILITNLQGDFLNGYRVENGKFVSRFRRTEEYMNTAARTGNAVCPQHGECTAESDCILCLQELEEVVVTAEAGGSGEYIDIYVGLNDFPGIDEGGADGPDMGMEWDYGPGEGMAPEDEDGAEEIVIDPEFSQNYPCQSDIVQQAYGVCSPLTQLILDIFEGDNDINLVFDFSDQNNGNASTFPLVQYNPVTHQCNINTNFTTSYLQTATDLSIARTTIHESIHAVLVYMVLEGMFIVPDGDSESGFITLMEGFITFLETNNVSSYAGAQHEIMSQLVGDIATSLSAFGSQNGYNLPFSYYEDMAWGGLTHIKDENENLIINPLFIQAVPNADYRERIINRIASETINNTQGNIIPTGQPCEN